MKILYTKHKAVKQFVSERGGFDHHFPSFFREHLRHFPPESTVIGNLPIPTVALICAAGHHYYHLIIPSARQGLSLSDLRARAYLEEFHVARID